MIPNNHIAELLINLGSTAEQVAQTLKHWQISGVRGSSCGCPIAIYIRQSSSMYAEVDVAVGLDTLYLDSFPVELTDAVKDFVFRFDEGEFSELDMTIG